MSFASAVEQFFLMESTPFRRFIISASAAIFSAFSNESQCAPPRPDESILPRSTPALKSHQTNMLSFFTPKPAIVIPVIAGKRQAGRPPKKIFKVASVAKDVPIVSSSSFPTRRQRHLHFGDYAGNSSGDEMPDGML